MRPPPGVSSVAMRSGSLWLVLGFMRQVLLGRGQCQQTIGQAKDAIGEGDLYRLMALPQAQLDFNGAWVIARDLRVGGAELRPCAACELHYLFTAVPALMVTHRAGFAFLENPYDRL